MKKTLVIELRSDLCAATGKGFAAVIDTDTAVDEYGIPFIPAKRIKGCLRENAKEVFEFDENTINSVFGSSGGELDQNGSLVITDAKIKNYDGQLGEIKKAIQAKAIKPDEITELFCSVRSETAVENDTVKDGSLRFTRVVNRLSPLDKKPLQFYADIEYRDDDKETIENLFNGLRNIGYHRNRGLGYIKCTFVEAEKFEPPQNQFVDEKKYRLTYLVYLQGDLMLPAADANHSLDYIPGTSVLGAFAAKYIQASTAFDNNLFLSKKVQFGNLYVSDEEGTDYIPAPGFLAKIKAAKGDEKGIHNMIANAQLDEKAETKPQYKPLKKGYINAEKGYKEVETEIVYHNATNSDAGLYTQYCISSGQYFKGSIEADGVTMKRLYPLFADGTISFGRSKNSQYSHCAVIADKLIVEEQKENKIELQEGKIAAYLCESDIILTDENSRNTVAFDDLCKALDVNIEAVNKFSRIASRTISGYHAKWNLKKPQFPVIKAGSAVVFHVDKTKRMPEYIPVGEKLNEGFGKIKLIPNAEHFSVAAKEAPEYSLQECCSELLRCVQLRQADNTIINKAIRAAKEINLNPSQVGRITLMCKESDCFSNFEKRLESIKTQSTKNAAKRVFSEDKIKGAIGEADWATMRRYILLALTVKKYSLRGKTKY